MKARGSRMMYSKCWGKKEKQQKKKPINHEFQIKESRALESA